MYRIRLFHWKAAEASERIAKLESAGFKVEYDEMDQTLIQRIRENPPDAVVIDLSRLPSHGRDIGLAIRQYKATRTVPLVLVEGLPEKIAKVKVSLPDAVYTKWNNISSSLERAISHPPGDPVVPKSLLDGYSGTPLLKKLGIKAGMVVGLIEEPPDIENILGKLPDGAKLLPAADQSCSLIIWFARLQEELERRLGEVGKKLSDNAGLWIAWPKKTSGITSDLTQNKVRQAGLASGLVDHKICAIDETWSALRFVRRKTK